MATSVLWTVQFRDSYRAQFYLSALQKSENEVRDSLSTLAPAIAVPDPDAILRGVLRTLGDQLDGILLPVIAHEVACAKDKLNENTPQKRYQAFFACNGQWTERAKAIPRKYPQLCKMLKMFCQSTTKCLVQCFTKLLADVEVIVDAGFIGEATLIGCEIGLSDRHRGGRSVIILTFAPDKRIVFKPRDLQPDLLLQRFTSLLPLAPPYDLKFSPVLVRDEYGWSQFICHKSCKSVAEVKDFYRRAGVLTAVMDSINYCDGHFENIVAAGAYPVIVDCETLFHNFEESSSAPTPEERERSILFTGLVEKPPKKGQQRGYSSAFQSPSVQRFYFLRPFGLKDGTDELSIQFRGIFDEPNHHSPTLEGKSFIANDFQEQFVQGFCYGYDVITKAVPVILSNEDWWKSVHMSRPRQLIRHTMFYELCIRRIQQPKCCTSEEEARKELNSILSGRESQYCYDPFMVFKQYETEDLLKLDIPYFEQMPGDKSIYASDGEEYTGIFTKTAADDMTESFQSRSVAYRDRQVEIIKNILIPSEHVLMQVYGQDPNQ